MSPVDPGARAMPKAAKLILACLVCLGLIIGAVVMVQRFF